MSTKDEKELVEPTPEVAGDIPGIKATYDAVQKIIDGVELEEDDLDQISGGTPWRIVGGQIRFARHAKALMDCPQSRNPNGAHQWVEFERNGDQVHCRCSYCGATAMFNAGDSWYIPKQ